MLWCFQTVSAPSSHGRATVRAVAFCCAFGPGAAGEASALMSPGLPGRKQSQALFFHIITRSCLLFLLPDLGSVIRQVITVQEELALWPASCSVSLRKEVCTM